MNRKVKYIGGVAKWAAIAVAVTALAACSLPRGAALTSEIVKEERSDTSAFQVVRVGRANAAAVAHWPGTGTNSSYRWPTGTRGPQSAVIRSGDKVNLSIWNNQENSLLTQRDVKSVQNAGADGVALRHNFRTLSG